MELESRLQNKKIGSEAHFSCPTGMLTKTNSKVFSFVSPTQIVTFGCQISAFVLFPNLNLLFCSAFLIAICICPMGQKKLF